MSQVTYEAYRGTTEITPARQIITKQLRPNDVFLEITHSGVCGTDLHFRHKDIVLGHEGVGIVRQVGEAVRDLKVGDVAGFGYTHEVCGHCDNCLLGWDQYCDKVVRYGFADFDTGSFSKGAVLDARWVFRIPDGLDPAFAAPLMCGGGTVWTVLARYGIQPTDRVAVMGIGGLGHLAIKMAAAMGCHVVVLSSSESKREEAFAFGAKEFHVLRNGEKLKEEIAPLNHLLLCGSSNADYNTLIPLMAANGTIYPLTADLDPSQVVLFLLSLNAVRVQGSLVVSSADTRKMLQFCAQHSITPQIQKFPLNETGIVNAMQSLKEGAVRYRAVLVAEN